MKFYLAPLEGLTTYVYRNVYHHFFHPMDKYFTPFIVPHPNRGFKPKELKEILPQHNQGLCVVPQILTNNAEDFIRTAQEFREYGYEEINLNLGCPSGTVTAKKKGSGFWDIRMSWNAFYTKFLSGQNQRFPSRQESGWSIQKNLSGF